MGMLLHHPTLDEFLLWEAEQVARHEFHKGEWFAMVGGTRGHNRVVVNLTRLIGNHLHRTACQVFSETMKVQIGDDTILYPDALVTCGRGFSAKELVVREPVLVAEVLSPSTEAYDRGRKFAMYRQLPSLREYVLIDGDAKQVDVFKTNDDGGWLLTRPQSNEVLHLSSIGFEIRLEELFEGMDDRA